MIVIGVGHLADHLGVHRNTIRNWIREGKLPARSAPGKGYMLKEDDFNKVCQEFGLDPARLKVRRLPSRGPGGLASDFAAPEVRSIGPRSTRLRPNPQWADACLTCGSCASACPLSGVDGLDPRKALRMVTLGLEDELIESQWPWKCTLCGKCEDACPMNLELVAMFRAVRGLRPRDQVPGPLHKGVQMCLNRGNNLGIPREDFLFLLEELGQELAAEECPGFTVPVDRQGANLLVTVNSKEPFGEPDDLKHWWKIFHAAGESWTVPSQDWEGVNWGLFTGDDEAMRTLVGRVVDNMRRLNCKTLLLPECGHAYYATRLGLQQWFAQEAQGFEVLSIFDLLLRYLREGRIRVDPGVHRQLTTYHDPCHYTRKSLKAFGQSYAEEGRWITRQCCPDFVEMYPGHEGNYCCGAGGGAWAMPFKEERVFYGRIKAQQIRKTGARLVIAPCHNCRDQILKSLNQEYQLDVEVKYIWELVADSLILPARPVQSRGEE